MNESIRKLKKKFKKEETNENENMMAQNFWDVAQTVIIGKYIAI